MKEVFLGIDVGSTSVKCVLLDKRRKKLLDRFTHQNKGITESLVEALGRLAEVAGPGNGNGSEGSEGAGGSDC